MTKDQEKRRHNRLNAFAIVFSFACVALGLKIYCASSVTDAYEYGQAYIPTIMQLQQALIDTESPRYDVGPKGADGNPGTDTLTAWKNYSFDICTDGEPNYGKENVSNNE